MLKTTKKESPHTAKDNQQCMKLCCCQLWFSACRWDHWVVSTNSVKDWCFSAVSVFSRQSAGERLTETFLSKVKPAIETANSSGNYSESTDWWWQLMVVLGFLFSHTLLWNQTNRPLFIVSFTVTSVQKPHSFYYIQSTVITAEKT